MWGGLALAILTLYIGKGFGFINVDCPEGWQTFGGSPTCYRIFDEKKDFERAQIDCTKYDSFLIEIEDPDTKDFIAKRVGESQQGSKSEGYWIGLRNEGSGWKWLNNHDLNTTIIGWFAGEPDPDPDGCGSIKANGKLSSEDCSQVELRYICGRNLNAPPKCKDGWKLYGDYCYMMITDDKNNKKTFEMAETTCEQLGGTLPIIKSKEENDLMQLFASQLGDGDSNEDAWIAIIESPWEDIVWINNDTVEDGYSNWFHSDNENQPVIMEGNGRGIISSDDGAWFLVNKDEEKYYFCQQTAGHICYKGLTAHSNMCYHFSLDVNSDVKSWQDASDECKKYNMNLPSFPSSGVSEWFNKKLIALDETPADSEVRGVWIGLKETETNSKKFYWTNGDTEFKYDARADDLTYDEEKRDCFWFGACDNQTECSTPTTKDKRWINDLCDEGSKTPHVYACEIKKGSPINVDSILKPKKKCEEGWTLFTDQCYLYRSDEETWQIARQWCYEKGSGSDLVSIHSQAENEFVASLQPETASAWIGFNRRSTSDWVWSDASSGYKYSNWDEKPANEDPQKCAKIASVGSNGKWNGNYCTQKSGFICKKPGTTGGSDVTTTLAPSNHNCGYHGEGWTEDPYTGMCYLVQETALAWKDAREECNSLAGYDEHADLASVNSYQEQVFITTLLKGREDMDSSVWIGLSDLNTENSFVWSDGTPVAYIYWNDGEPNSLFEYEDCVEIKPVEGFGWNDERCNVMKPAVCEKRGRNYRPPSPPPQPKVQCAAGWLEFNQKCFYFGIDQNVVSYKDALSNCHALNSVSDLASITSKEEMDWIIDGKLGTDPVYIGAKKTDGIWGWEDGSSWDYSNWGKGQPDNELSECALIEIKSDEDNTDSGWWNDVDCSKYAKGYICSYDNFLCPPNWKNWGDSCWYSSDSADTYQGASQACKDMSSHAQLAYVYNEMENWFLKDYEEQLGTNYNYIGAHWDGNKWSWEDNSAVNFTNNFADGLPGPGSGECILLINTGDWTTTNCSDQHKYSCRMEASNYLGCPLGWSLYGVNCYLVQDEMWTWPESEKQCGLKGGDLASMLSFQEQEEVFSIIHSGPNCPEGYVVDNGFCIGIDDSTTHWTNALSTCEESDAHLYYVFDQGYQNVLERQIEVVGNEMFWLGARKENATDPWMWLDGTEMTFTNWRDPDGINEKTGCVYLSRSDYKWHVGNCAINSYLFICSKNQSPDNSPRWIGLSDQSSFNTFEWSDGNPVLYTRWAQKNPVNVGSDPACVYMDSLWGGWRSGDCSESKGSICKMPAMITGPPDNDGCQANEIAYRSSCYAITLSYQTFDEANKECTKWSGHLVTIDSDYEQAKITTIVAELGIHFYIGMKFNNDSSAWEWTDGDVVGYTHWAEFEPDMDDDDGSGLCVYMHRHEDIGFWKATSCSDKLASICEYPRHIYTEPPPTTTPPPPELKCPDDFSWSKYNDHCYKAFEESELNGGKGFSFEDGRNFCQSKGGNLVTFENSEEETTLDQNSYWYASSAYWIGLRQYMEEGGEGEGYTWVDETPLTYVNWWDGYPNSNDGSRNCIVKDQNSGFMHWTNRDCAETNAVICEISASVEEITTAEPPTLPPPIACGNGNPEGWVQMEDNSDFCYLLYSDSRMFFDDADKYCKQQGGRLVSIHKTEENTFVKQLFEDSLSNGGWIGVTDRNIEGFETVDGSPADYFHWAPNEPNHYDDSESCVTINANSGEWNDVSCGTQENFVCKKPREGEFTTPATTSVPGGHCPQDWYEYEGRCYKIFGTEEEGMKNWTEARAFCKTLSIDRALHRAELASIHNSIQNAFLVVETAKFPENGFWIGLNNMHSWWDGTFLWSDETPLDYTSWDTNEPNGQYQQQCVEMYGYHQSAGGWNDKDCTELLPFICMLKAEESIPTQGPIDYAPCNDESLASQGFYQLAQNCYKYEMESMNWEAAEAKCTDYGVNVHMVSMLEKLEENFAYVLSGEYDFWIGLKKTDEVWKWSDNWDAEYTNWYNSEFTNGSCASFHHRKAKWFQEDCIFEKSFVCKYSENVAPTSPPRGPCPEGWYNYEGKCYKAITDLDYNGYSWGDASIACMQLEGTNGEYPELVSFHSQQEVDAVIKMLPDPSTLYQPAYWIGLKRTGTGFAWEDASAVDFENWNDGEPNDEHEFCIEAVAAVGLKWNDNSCNQFRYPLCQTGIEVTTSPAAPSTTTADIPTLPPPIACGNGNPEGWVQMQDNSDFCYLLYNNSRMFFDDADKYCKQQGGRLVSIHKTEENTFVRQLFENNLSVGGWIGITDRNIEGFQTVDGSPADYFNWAPNEPNHYDDSESCVTLNANSGEWNDVSCGTQENFVCKKPREGEFTTPATTNVPGGHCPQDWYEYEGRCYKIFGVIGEEMKNYTAARQFCKTLSINRAFHQAELASIHSPIQNAFLVVETSKFPENGFWIGLNNMHSWWDGTFLWSDETPLDYTSWDTNEPNGQYQEQCVEMYGYHHNAGGWNDRDCSDPMPFICMLKAEESIPTQGPIDYAPCNDESLASQGFYQLAQNCYKYEMESMNWDAAEAKCADYGANVHMVSMLEKLEENFAYVLSGEYDFWIGLKKTDEVWKWSDNWDAEYTNWYNSEFTNGSCAAFHHREAKWFQEDCTEVKSFVCKYSENVAPTPPPRGPCPEGWQNYEAKCYKSITDDVYGSPVNWGEALTACMQLAGTNGEYPELVSFHSQQEVDAVIQMLPDPSTLYQPGYWIGMRRTGTGFAWEDGSAVDFENWNEGEPNDEHEFCIEAVAAAGLKWNDQSCSEFRYPLCQTGIEVSSTAAVPSTTTPKHTTQGETTATKTTAHPSTTKPKTTPKPQTTSTTADDNSITTPQNTNKKGMSGGAVASIVIVVLAACVLTILVLIQLGNNNWDWRRILPGSDGTAPLLGKVQGKGRSPASDKSFTNVAYKTDTKTLTTNTASAPSLNVTPNILI